MRAYDSGILIWVDDDFAHGEHFGEGREIDLWTRLFGSNEAGFPWLLDLALIPVEDAERAEQVLKDINSEAYGNSYVQAVLDMRIPKRTGEVPQKKFGLRTASLYREQGIDFSILSSKTDAQAELADHNLQGTPYYNKQPAPSATMMPGDLTRRILHGFRSNISWVDIGALIDNWVHAPNLPHPFVRSHAVARHFPFFSTSREFIERWETRHTLLRRSRLPRIVLRAPEHHSDEFIAQCCAIILGAQNPNLDHRVAYVHAKDPNARAVLDGGKPDVKIVRFSADDKREIQNEVAFLRHLLAGREPGEQLFFILPQDERAESFLDFFSNERDVIFDDLPNIRPGNLQERELHIRRILEYHLSRLRIPLDGGGEGRVHNFYLDHPEVLFHPLFWTFLLESKVLAAEFTDAYEMQVIISDELQGILEWPAHARQLLVEGRAMPPEFLLEPARDIFQTLEGRQTNWATTTLKDWLVKSWQTPYGCIDARREILDDVALREWEELCLHLARDLAQNYRDKVIDAGGEVDPVLSQATTFILADAITKLIDGNAGDANWAALEALRWPHAHCPMPTALNQKLKAEGRYLFVQTDFLDRATYTPSGTQYLRRIEDFAQLLDQRLLSVRRNIPHLPAGWSKAANIVLRFVRSGYFANPGGADEPVDREIWFAALSLAKNATITSYLFHAANKNNGIVDDDKLAKLRGKGNRGTGGEGALLGLIRDERRNAMNGGLLRPRTPVMPGFDRDQRMLERLSSALLQFADHEPQDGLDIMTKAIRKLSTLLSTDVASGDQASDAASLEARVRAREERLFPSLFGDRDGLQSNAFFDGGFSLSKDHASLPVSEGALRGSELDLLFWLSEWSDLAYWTLRPLQYSDGYHFLAMLRDQRNNLKDGVPYISKGKMAATIELFLFGFNGLVAQLSYCLALMGREDLAQRFELPGYEAAQNHSLRDAGIAEAMKIVDLEDGGYAMFQVGYPGNESSVFTYIDSEGSSIREDGK